MSTTKSEGWRSARFNSNPRYVYGSPHAYAGVVLYWYGTRWIVEWWVQGQRDIHQEDLPGTLTETEAQAMALAVWRMR